MIITLPRAGDPHAVWSQEEDRAIAATVDKAIREFERLKLEPDDTCRTS
jgi:hypothetical protein